MSDNNTLTIRIPLGAAYSYLERTGTVEEVADFLKLDTESESFKRSPFAAIAGVVHAGSLWASADFQKKASEASKSGKA